MKKFRFFLAAFLMVFYAAVALAQIRSVKGTVTGASDGLPVVGATVTVDGNTKYYAITDLDGNFQINNIPAGSKEIIVSNLGSMDAHVPIAPEVKVVLEDDNNVLEAAVATGMYTVDRRLNTGSTVKVNAEDANISGISPVPWKAGRPVCLSRTFPVPSVRLRKSAFAAQRPSMVLRSRCGSWTASSWKMSWT